jgi:hypothetical protein
MKQWWFNMEKEFLGNDIESFNTFLKFYFITQSIIKEDNKLLKNLAYHYYIKIKSIIEFGKIDL